MSYHDVAYFKEQGQNLVIVMVDPIDVQTKGPERVLESIRLYAANAGLIGKTAICWMSGSTPMYYGPPDLTRFLAGILYLRLPWNRRLVIP